MINQMMQQAPDTMQQPQMDAATQQMLNSAQSPWLQMQLQNVMQQQNPLQQQQMRQQNAPPSLDQQVEQRPLLASNDKPTPSLWEMVQRAAQSPNQRKVEDMHKETQATGTENKKLVDYSKGYNSAQGTGNYKVFSKTTKPSQGRK